MKREKDKLLGERLRSWRKWRALKGKDLAEIIGTSSATISEIENGKSLPSAETLAHLHNKSSLNIVWLLTGQGEWDREVVLGSNFQGKSGAKPNGHSREKNDLSDTVEKFVRIYMNADSVKRAHILGFLSGADQSS